LESKLFYEGSDLTMKQGKDEENRLFVYVHVNSQDQQNFIIEAENNNYFVQPINFMGLQAGKDIYTNKIYLQDKEITSIKDVKSLWNGIRPYLSISSANPDNIGNYFNWTFLESIIETGWREQFPKWG
jgi:hypothetical protein